MERILVIGAPGSGKSTLAKKIGATLGLPVVHLDQYFWRPGWVAPPEQEWVAAVEKLSAQAEWVIEGNYAAALPPRLARAQCVVLLDAPRLTALCRTVRRSLTQLGKIRADSAPGCPERLSLAFWLFAWRYKKQRMPKMEAMVRNSGLPVVRLRSRCDIAEWLAQFHKQPEHVA